MKKEYLFRNWIKELFAIIIFVLFIFPLNVSASQELDVLSGEDVVNYATNETNMNLKYNNYDCSKFVQYIYSYFGISLPRGCKDYADEKYSAYGEKIVDRSKLKPGDIVLYGSNNSTLGHAGIYIGDGQIVNSLNSSKNVIIMKIDSYTSENGYHYQYAVRPYALTQGYFKNLRNENVTDSDAVIACDFTAPLKISDEGFYISKNSDMKNYKKISEGVATTASSNSYSMNGIGDRKAWYGPLDANTVYYWQMFVVTPSGEKKTKVHQLRTGGSSDIPLQSFTLNKTILNLNAYICVDLKVTSYTPSNTTSSKIATWTSTNTNVVSVNSNGMVTVEGEGTAVIVCTIDGITSSCMVKVSGLGGEEYPLESFNLNKSSLSLNNGTCEKLYVASYVPSNTTSNKIALWTSSNTNVATVDQTGMVTTVGVGSTTITCTIDGISKTCKVTVTETNTSVFKNLRTESVTSTDARILGDLVSYTDVTDEGFYISTNSNMSGAQKISEGVAVSKLSGISYGMNKWYGVLSPGTTYYWKLYIVTGGVEKQSDVQNFKTEGVSDTEKPSITEVWVTDQSNSGYTIHCKATDNVGVTDVRFPTWTEANGQDDLASVWPSVKTPVNGIYSYRVNISDHNNEGGVYMTHVYAYDAAGNYTSYGYGVVIDRTIPVITEYQIADLDETGYTVKCKVTDNVKVNNVVFPTWTDASGQDDIIKPYPSVTTTTDGWYVYRVKVSEHNGEYGNYVTHLYAYDTSGNQSDCKTIPYVWVKPALTGTVTISGSLKYGQTLTAKVSNSNNTGTLSYQWKRGTTAISGATASTYKLVKEDIGNTISCEVTSDAAFKSISGTTASNVDKADGPAAPTSYSVQKPSISGLSDGKITLAQSNTYQYAADASFSSATKITGTVISGLKAGTYYVRIAGTETTHSGAYATITVPEGDIPVLTGTVTISGTLKYNQTLTASVSNTNNTGTLSYQWMRAGVAISGATSQTYKTVEADIGKKLSCVVTSSEQLSSISGETSTTIDKANGPAAPTGYTVQKTSKAGASDGKIIMAQSGTYQYADNEGFTNAKKITGTEITGLTAGTYYVRFAGTTTTHSGAAATITVEDGGPVLDSSSPVLLGATAGSDKIIVTWKANELVDKYAVFRKVSGGTWTKIVVTKGTADGSTAEAGLTCSYDDATAEAGVTYYYSVRGMNAAGKFVTSYDTTGVSATIKKTETLDKSSPVLLGATAGENSITVSWKANSGVDKYAVFRKVSGGSWAKVAETTGTANGNTSAAGQTCSYVDGTAQAGVTYSYSVRGMNSAGKFVTSYDTTGVSATIRVAEPLDKSSPVMTGATAGTNGITVSWKANSGVDKYTVFRKTAGGKWAKYAESTGTANGTKAVAGATCNYIDASAEAGVTYYYTVRGMNAAGSFVTSYDTTGVSAAIQMPVDTSSPVLIGATAGQNTITFSWTANNGVAKYTVFRKTTGGWSKAAEVDGANGGTTLSYADQAVVAGTTYTYTARGMDANGKYITSYNTTGVSATIAAQEVLDKNAPVLIGANASSAGIVVTWIANSGVDRYAIFRKTTGGWTKVDEAAGASAGSICNYVDRTAVAGTTYTYTVRGMDANGKYVTSYDTTGKSCTK